ncbi:MAG: NAD(P)/FAD-dependent oxidoreductase [Oscillospiraceae bacterium]|nr:NAD(P)/FAD-dependent oxidoreductase [Oscillospiraceae bacterium]
MKKILVIGGGPAGLIAAGTAARAGHTVTLLERNPRCARKLMITGKGRCNVTNNATAAECIANIPGNGRFLYSALTAFPPAAVMALLEEMGVPLKTERGGRVFPVSDKAVDVVDGLVRFAKQGGVSVIQGRAAELLVADGRCAGVRLETGAELPADAVIVATGGLSYPSTGSTGDGYALARQAGHTVTPLRPSLVALESGESWIPPLAGLSLKNCGLSVTDTVTGKVIFRDFGEMLFTHTGVSGPMVLSASAHMTAPLADGENFVEPDRYTLSIDWKPALTLEQLESRLLRDFADAKNRDFGSVLAGLLPRAMVPAMAARCMVSPHKKTNAVTREERARLVIALKNFTFSVTGFRPIEEAVVTAGGVSVKEIDAKTMASKKLPGLYFAGEVIDVNGYTGGYNLQIAFSTGYAAAVGGVVDS